MNSPEALLSKAYDDLRMDLKLAETNADEAWEGLLAKSKETGEAIATCHWATYLICLAHSHRAEEVFALAPPVIEVARREDDVESEALLLHALGLSHWYQRQMDLALDATQLGIRLLQGLTSYRKTLGGFYDLEGVVNLNSGRLEESLVSFQKAREIWDELGMAGRLLGNRLNYACALQHKGDFSGALAGSLEARKLLEGVEDVVTRGRLAFNVAIIHRALEDVDSALAEAHEAVAYCVESGDDQTLVGAYCILAEVLVDIGDNASALENTLLAQARMESGVVPLSRVNLQSSIGDLFRRLGKLGDARRCLLAALADTDHEENPLCLFDVRCHLVELSVDEGDVTGVVEVIDDLYEKSKKDGTVEQQIKLLRIGSDAWEQTGDLQKALDWQRKSMQEFTEHHSVQAEDKLRSLQIKHKLDKSLEIQRTLKASQAVLEQHVEQRTRELTEANRKLEREIQERQGAEEEAVKLQASLRQAERLESLGRLAGGVAHDFNNLLTVVMGSARMLSEDYHDDIEITAYAEEILQAGRSGSRLTERLLAFSKRWDMTISEVEIKDLLSNVLFLTERLIGDSIELKVELSDSEAMVSIDTSQLDSVFMNLALNARDSMPTGGTLRVSSQIIDEHDLVNPLQQDRSGRVLRILMEDQGQGIDDKDLDFIFDPFFTTKSPDKGTGLGLSSSLGIIQHLGGRLTLVRTSSEGTLFEVLLPILEVNPEVAVHNPNDLIPNRAQVDRSDALRGKRILLVEDDVAVRRLLSTQLKFMQLEVFEAQDGKHALEVFDEARPDVILSDVNMPRMSGPELLGELRSRGVETPMLLASGWPEHHADQMPGNAGTVGFLQKPFELRVLRCELVKITGQKPALDPKPMA